VKVRGAVWLGKNVGAIRVRAPDRQKAAADDAPELTREAHEQLKSAPIDR
jgi:hypothetical protein